jgi:hypothetical protein
VGAWLIAAALLGACSKSTPPSPRRQRGPGIGPVIQDAPDPMQARRPAEPLPLLPQEQLNVGTANAAQAAPDKPPAADQEPRDYPTELLQRLGNPASCLAQRASDATLAALRIGISAQLMPSGAVARTELQAPELSGAERACIAQRVGAVRLPGPIAGAPFGIQATLTLQPSASKPGAAARPAAVAGPQMADAPGAAAEGSAFLEPSPEAKEVPAAPPVQPMAEGTTP